MVDRAEEIHSTPVETDQASPDFTDSHPHVLLEKLQQAADQALQVLKDIVAVSPFVALDLYLGYILYTAVTDPDLTLSRSEAGWWAGYVFGAVFYVSANIAAVYNLLGGKELLERAGDKLKSLNKD